MPRLAAYLSPRVVRRLAADPPAPPHRETIEAALLLSDVSGFTALTEDLQSAGRRGAEEIAAAVDRAFCPAIRAIERAGGSIESFGGDALFSIFEGAGAVRRAKEAAGAIATWSRRHPRVRTPLGPRAWEIAQVLHYGRFASLTLGTAERRATVLVGPVVRALARMESRAGAGEIVVSAAARGRRDGAARGPAGRASPSPAALRWFLPERLRPLMERAEGSYRRASVLFLESRGDDLAGLQGLFMLLASALERYEGVLLKTDISPCGVRWLCLFGLPETHEDDPDRAARAALDIVTARPASVELRGGLHAGTLVSVVVGTPRRRSLDVMGDVVNIAARAMGAAPWGEVLVTDGTRQQLRATATRAEGARMVKGKRQPLELHALQRSAAVRRVLRATAPLVGRTAEMAALHAALEEARAGRAAVLALRGEPGVGKSRLKLETARGATARRMAVHEGRALPFGGHPWQAIGDLVRSLVGVPPEASGSTALELVAASCGRLGMDDRDAAHLARLMGSTAPSDLLRHLSPEALRADDALALRRWLRAMASTSPLLLVLEDLQWADEQTVLAVRSLVADGGIPGALLLLVHRPGYQAPSGVRELVLREVPPEVAATMVRQMLGSADEALVARLADHAGGNPLHVEELVRHLRDAGLLAPGGRGWHLTREPREDDLPPTLEALVAGRLDRLSPSARRVAQVASVVGRRFGEATVARVAGIDDLGQALEELASREVAFPAGAGERIFKHALVRDVAYASILVAARRGLHGRVARTLEEMLGAKVDGEMAALGHHWEQAGNTARAGGCYLRGARRAYEGHAFEEAARLASAHRRMGRRGGVETLRSAVELELRARYMAGTLGAAGDLVARLRRSARRLGAKREEGLALLWLALLHGRRGDAVRARRNFDRSIGCLVEAADPASEASARDELGVFLRESGDYEGALAEHGRAMELAQGAGNPAQEAVGRGNRAALLRLLGRYDEARSELGIVREAAQGLGDLRMEGVALGSLATLEMEEGRLPEAEPLLGEALGIVRRVGDLRAEIALLGNLAVLHGWRGEDAAAVPLYERVLALCDRLGEVHSRAIALQNLGGLLARQGRLEEALPMLREAIAIFRRKGARRMLVDGLCALSEFLAERDPDAAEELRQDAVRESGPEAESPTVMGTVERIAGILARHRGDLAAAEEHLRRSVDLLRIAGDAMELAKSERELGRLVASGPPAAAPGPPPPRH